MSTCRSCGAPIRWELTSNGKRIPLDPEPRPDGNLAIRDDGRVTSDHGYPPDAPRYVTHFATCPHAAEHRKRPGPEARSASTATEGPTATRLHPSWRGRHRASES